MSPSSRVQWAAICLAILPACIPKDGAHSPESPEVASPPPGGNLLRTSTFDDGKSLPWMPSFSPPAAGSTAVNDGAYCLTIDARGKNPWDAQIRHREMTIEKGHSYSVRFKAYASRPTRIRPKIGMAGPPYREYWYQTLDLTPSPQIFSASFTMRDPDDPTAEFAIHAAGALAKTDEPVTVCIDDVYLTDPEFTPTPHEPEKPIPIVRVNQVGYLPAFPKVATIELTEEEPQAFTLVDQAGDVVFEGKTTVFGRDAASGEHVHWASFGTFDQVGSSYRLRTGAGQSEPFDVRPDVYSTLKYDALAYFYHNRSGIPIELPYAGEKQWTRPAGHLGDSDIPCAKDAGCTYSLDVRGGWYDAGDHGKYVVNGGIAVWTLLNLYERTRAFGSTTKDFGDGKLNIPESKNGVPDLLDEVRWEVEFLLRMQVPEGQPLAGMAHHKMHDEEWTALGTAPHEAEKKVKRFLRPPSTAATLNLAAAAAQSARVFRSFDAAFATLCQQAAERAWKAARAHPQVFAPAADEKGGGPYDDDDVSDEFYWAAAELFVTTGKAEYRAYVEQSPYLQRTTLRGTLYGDQTAMTWRDTAALGTLTLAVVPNKLPKERVKAARNQILGTADQYRALIEKEGYRVPVSSKNGYVWGSNSFVLNNCIVLALAGDLSAKAEYAHAVADGMDYLLGRNPLSRSYVTGYGDNPVQNPHHRFWSHEVNPKRPSPPPGAVSGGPNSALQDPYVRGMGLAGCAPQTCFVDHIESYSTNEITINWNAPLAWVAAYLDEKAQ